MGAGAVRDEREGFVRWARDCARGESALDGGVFRLRIRGLHAVAGRALAGRARSGVSFRGRCSVDGDFRALVAGRPGSMRSRARWSRAVAVIALACWLGTAGSADAQFDACERVQCPAGQPCRSEKRASCTQDTRPDAGASSGEGGWGGTPFVCRAVEVALCGPKPCERDDECERGEICFGTIALADARITDPCPDEEICEVEPELAEGSAAILGWCMAARRCESNGDCDGGAACLDYRYQCSCPEAAPGETCGGGGVAERRPDGTTLCVCECQSGVCSSESLQGVGGHGAWSLGDPGGAGTGVRSGGVGGSFSASGGNGGEGNASGGSGAGFADAGAEPSFGSGSAEAADRETPSVGACAVSAPGQRETAPWVWSLGALVWVVRRSTRRSRGSSRS